jgi:hypothetical protein
MGFVAARLVWVQEEMNGYFNINSDEMPDTLSLATRARCDYV